MKSETKKAEYRLHIWRREWQPTPVFLPGEFYGHRSLVGSCPWGCKMFDTTKWLMHSNNDQKDLETK